MVTWWIFQAESASVLHHLFFPFLDPEYFENRAEPYSVRIVLDNKVCSTDLGCLPF